MGEKDVIPDVAPIDKAKATPPVPEGVGNEQLVSVQGATIIVMSPKRRMGKREALIHAAFIVSLADPSGKAFPEILKQVQSI